MEITRSTKTSRDRSKKDGEFETVDWFVANSAEKLRRLEAAKATAHTDYLNYIWPAGISYCTPFQSLFLAQVRNFEALNSEPMWLARDGLLPLLWFFRAHPQPGSFRQKILIHEDLIPYAPAAWTRALGTYRIQSFGTKSSPVEKLFLIGIASEPSCSIKHLTEELEKLKKHFGPSVFSSIEKTCYVTERFHTPGIQFSYKYVTDYLFKLGRLTCDTAPLTSMEHTAFEAQPSFEGYGVREINQKTIVADTYMLHSALRRGARLVEPGPAKNSRIPGRFVRLSPFHGYFVRTSVPKAGVRSDEQEEFVQTLLRSDFNLKMPWPDWVVSWKTAESKKATFGV